VLENFYYITEVKTMRKRIKQSVIVTVLMVLVVLNYAYAEIIPFNSELWEIKAKESKIEEYLGKKSLFLGPGGMAVINDSEFTDGIIEYDVALPQARGFMGAMWRLQDESNYEEFYMRAHQSGNPDANQYTPVFHGLPGWQLYYGEGYGAPVKYAFNEWLHVKIVVFGPNAEVYINDMENPVLFAELKREMTTGKVGLRVAGGPPGLAGGHFADFSYTSSDNPPLKGQPKEPEKVASGTILSWSVSNTFDEKSLAGKFRLTENDKQDLAWTTLATERTGLANLARVQGPRKGKNTVFARVIVVSEKEQVKPLQFGFSDRVNVFFNDRLLYSGNNTYRTRDYRYLGTIGFFNAVYLPLNTGENELWMAVSESFGGWGIQAKFPDMEGISIKE